MSDPLKQHIYGEWVIVNESIPDDLESALLYLELWKKFILRRLKKHGLSFVSESLVRKPSIDTYIESTVGIKIYMEKTEDG